MNLKSLWKRIPFRKLIIKAAEAVAKKLKDTK
jgi:hypothetical protein